MWKYLAIFVAVFGLAIYVAHQDERAAQRSTQKASQHDNAGISPTWWYEFVRWPNGTATWAIILTLFAIAEQTGQTAKAAKATELSVKAAESNTQALINAERAWIVVSVESPAPNQFHFRATNVGKTPAKVKSIWTTSIIVKREEELQVPSDDKTGESLMNTPSCLIPPTASQIVFRCNIEDMEKKRAFGQNMIFAQGFVNLWFYGRIVYSDTLQPDDSPLHETKWLYWHIPVEEAIPFPDPHRPEYNSYT